MTIRLLCVGKIKESFYREAAAELIKRLSRYACVEIVEVAEEKAPEGLSAAGRDNIINAEGARLLSRIGDGDHTVALCIEGRTLSSPALASHMQQAMTGGRSTLSFVIGGSLGLSAAVLARADFCLSFGAMTFPHQLFRIMLLEQIYRSFRIMNNEPYHK